MAKDYFNANNIAYENFDVSSDAGKRAEMMEKSGQLGVPVIVIKDKIIIGFNKPKIAELLGLNQKAEQVTV
ncbi:MAG: glutaredoxin-like protein [Parcubacteria group bacterium Gr01-1014_46]|nr:MAG: glutaredoxin-like protein [Parcubacteria group bacterium Gr01-1014_46]